MGFFSNAGRMEEYIDAHFQFNYLKRYFKNKTLAIVINLSVTVINLSLTGFVAPTIAFYKALLNFRFKNKGLRTGGGNRITYNQTKVLTNDHRRCE